MLQLVWTVKFLTRPPGTGSILMSAEPHVAVLSGQYLDSHCSSCCGPASSHRLKRCTRCQAIWYCDAACQNRDWFMHKFECTAIQNWASTAPSSELAIPSEAVRCLGRIAWTQRKKGLGSAWSREINAMQSHRPSLSPSVTETHTHLAHSLVRYLGLTSSAGLTEFGVTSAGDLVDMISRASHYFISLLFITNTFTLTSPALTPLGITVSPPFALINHSCDPNAVIVFPRANRSPSKHEPLMQLVALREIRANEEILTAYIDTTLPRMKRQQSLQETYSFDCRCGLCSGQLDLDPRESMWCPKSCGGICPLPTEENNFTRCAQCKSVVSSTEAVLDALRVGQEGLDKANLVQLRDPAKAIQLTSNLIPILISAGLTPSCHPLLALTRLHQSLLISSFQSDMTQDILDETIRMIAKSTAGLSSNLRVGHPVRGVALAELGKALAVDEPAPKANTTAVTFPPSGPQRLKSAYETLVQARNELFIGFGKQNDGGQVGQEIRESIVSLEKEIGVWSQGVRNVIQDIPKPDRNKA
ncbi:hypothetical protein PILCRDRAFT_78079 [Piloderma croceum F 1598]|uniref:MYND-type domain-containing protein n=1 Tax=Piloderma croceum (strain F 1598) TaxID=765440 RepID=A0A0C3AQK6_PILCF|nr:hypothetical protein PILCRDRAFT_78079 [Piloderma croceum F 1598]